MKYMKMVSRTGVAKMKIDIPKNYLIRDFTYMLEGTVISGNIKGSKKAKFKAMLGKKYAKKIATGLCSYLKEWAVKEER